MRPPSEHYLLLWNLFSSARGDLQSPPASLLYSLPPLPSYLISRHPTWIEKQRKTRQDVHLCGFYSAHNTHFFELICITPFHCFFCLCVILCLWMMPFFINRSSAMQIARRHSNLVCQRPSLNPSFWVNIPCCFSLHIHPHLIGHLKAFNVCIINVSLMHMWKEGKV